MRISRRHMGRLAAVLILAGATGCRSRSGGKPEFGPDPTPEPIVDPPRPLQLDEFYALRTGLAPMGTDTCTLSVHDLGELTINSGGVEASDPFVNLGSGRVFTVQPGSYPVCLTVANFPQGQRNAYLSLMLTAEPATSVEYLTPEGKPPPGPGELYGISVDAGLAGFVDAAAVTSIPDDFGWTVLENGRPDAWIDATTRNNPKYANVVVPFAPNQENIIFCDSGWGDGFYPLVATRSADGRMTAIHIDFQVVYVE